MSFNLPGPRLFIALTLSLVLFSCHNRNPSVVQTGLAGSWEFRKVGDEAWYPAKVPGTLHDDLLDNGLIPDPFYREQEEEVKWIEKEDWEYRLQFSLEKDILSRDHVELNFGGLDTYADVYLNDSLVLVANNMFRSWTVDVAGILENGENELRIYFHSAVNLGMKKLKRLPYTLPATNEQAPEKKRTNVFTRKAPFHYGWDWGPRLVTCGVWRPVTVKAWNRAIIRDIHLRTASIGTRKALCFANIELQCEKAMKADILITIENQEKPFRVPVVLEPGLNTTRVDFEVLQPKLWWTNGLGEQHLYSIKVDLISSNQLVQSWTGRMGLRELELVREKDTYGTSFYFKLNGRPVFMKGANFIPLDILTPRVSKEHYAELVDNAVMANMNMLRVWGGAIYEEDVFYDLCDEKGILVWQDFMFACSLQPGDKDHVANIRAEAEENVRRLRNHPSIALWCGNNENLMAWHKWGWKESFSPAVSKKVWKDYEYLFHDMLPEVVDSLDPDRSYWPSSPQSENNQLADLSSGDTHDWSVWFATQPFSNFENEMGRFVSEYGVQSFPSIQTIMAFADSSDLHYRSKVMEHRQRSNMPWIAADMNGNEMIMEYIRMYYNEPVNFEDYVYLSQLMQAKAISTAIHTHRRNMPMCMGSLYWQINDCWPTISWSTVDYYGRWKAAHFEVRKANNPLLISPTIIENKLRVYLVNDQPENVEGLLKIQVMNFSGKIVYSDEIPATAAGNSSGLCFTIDSDKLSRGYNKNELLVSLSFSRQTKVLAETVQYFSEPKYLDLPVPDIKINIERSQGAYFITLLSDKLARNVQLSVKDTQGSFSDNYFDLLPNIETRIKYSTSLSLTDVEGKLEVYSLVDSY